MRYMLLLLAFTSCALIIAAFLVISLERPVIYQVQFINDNGPSRSNTNDPNKEKLQYLPPVYLNSHSLSGFEVHKQRSSYDILKSVLNNFGSNKTEVQPVVVFNKDHKTYSKTQYSTINTASTNDESKNSPCIYGECKNPITIKDVLITVKTTAKYHETRLKLIAQTWFNHASNQVS